MGVEEAIINELLDTSAVTALTAQRIFPMSRRQGTTLPAVTVQMISRNIPYCDEGEVGLTEDRLQVDCWGATYSSAKAVARAVVEKLSAFDGSPSGVEIQFAMLEDERDSREGGSGAESYLFRTSLDFIVWSVR